MSERTSVWRRVVGQLGQRGVATNTAIVALAFACSRVLGFLREVIVAARFGTGDDYDAYIAAFRLPDLLFTIIMSGAFGAAFIPVFGSFWASGDTDRAWHLANALLGWTLVILVGASLVVLAFAEPLIARAIAPDLSPDAQEVAVDLTRLLLVSPLFLGLSAAAKGMLEARDRFTLPAVAPMFYNVGIIAGALVLTPSLGIHGLALGVIVGSIVHAAVQFAAVLRHGLHVRPTLARHVDGLAKVARLAGPRIVNQLVGQSNLVVVTNLASRAVDGSISALFYGQHLVMLPHGILAMSVSTVIFPRMAREFAAGQVRALRTTLVSAVAPLMLLALLSSVVLLTLRRSLVQVTLQYGAFGAESAVAVSEAVAWLSVGLLGRCLIEPLTRAFYAMHDTRTPLVVAVMAVVVNIALGVVLMQRFGLAGITLSLSLTYTLRMVALVMILSTRIDGLVTAFLSSFGRMLPAIAITTAAGLLLAEPLVRATDPATGRNPGSYLIFGLAAGGMSFLYLATAHAARVPAVSMVVGRLMGLRRRV